MAKADKLLEKMRSNPRGWRYGQVRSILERHGFHTHSTGGSHRVFKHPSGARVLIVDPGSGTLLPVYVDEAVAAIDRAAERGRA